MDEKKILFKKLTVEETKHVKAGTDTDVDKPLDYKPDRHCVI